MMQPNRTLQQLARLVVIKRTNPQALGQPMQVP